LQGGYYERDYDDYSFWQAIEEQQCRQRDHISMGVESGQLTNREIRILRDEQHHVTQQISHYRQLGHLDFEYQRELMNYLDHASKRISYLKHNNEYFRELHNHPNSFTNYKYRRSERNNHPFRMQRNDVSTRFHVRF